MMTSLKITNFKAYREELDRLPLDDKNFLLYGENGSGKSSIYDAIKVVFFKNKLVQGIPVASTPDEQPNINNNFWAKYKNNSATSAFEIKINDTDYDNFDTVPYQVFMIAMDKLCMENSLRLDKLLEKFDISIDNIEEFCTTNYENIERKVNDKLQVFREENIIIVIDNEDNFSIKITDTTRGLSYKENIENYFNEAKLNLIILLLLFESIQCAKNSDKKKILVLDDFITSLDVSNRTFLMKYILESFHDFQILIFTHNVYFYNLIMYLVNDIYKVPTKWKFANVYEIDNKHKLYIKGGIDTVGKIRDFYGQNNGDIEGVGNKIRQRFEVLLYEFSKLLMVGAVEDSKKIIERIENTNNVYFNNKKTASDLVDELDEIVNLTNLQNLQNRLKSKINSYKKDRFQNFKEIIRDLKLYQKVTLHPMSHGTIGQSSFTQTDIAQSLDLLEKFENYLKDLIDSDVDHA